MLSKSPSRQEDERGRGAAAHPFPVSSSKHRQNSFSNRRGAGRTEGERGGGRRERLFLDNRVGASTKRERERGEEGGVENGSGAWTLSTCVVLLAALASGGERGFWLCIRNHERQPTTA